MNRYLTDKGPQGFPVVARSYDHRGDALTVLKLDVDENQSWAVQFGVMGIPALLLFKDGEVVERITGYMPKHGFLARLEPHLN